MTKEQQKRIWQIIWYGSLIVGLVAKEVIDRKQEQAEASAPSDPTPTRAKH